MCYFIGIAFITKMCKENAQRAIFTAMALRQYKNIITALLYGALMQTLLLQNDSKL